MLPLSWRQKTSVASARGLGVRHQSESLAGILFTAFEEHKQLSELIELAQAEDKTAAGSPM